MSTPTPPDAEPTPDREERELSELYRRLPRSEPDAALDARVLGAAERAVARPRPSRRRVRWLMGLGSAATLVMAAGLTWHLAGTGPAPRPAGSPAAARGATTGAANQVVPVRILSAQRAERARAAQARDSAGAVALPPPPSALATKALPPASTHAPRAAQVLIAEARQALAGEDQGRARFLVRRIVKEYPGLKLPPDLVPYAPTASSGKGSP